jgi:hypothetical protein
MIQTAEGIRKRGHPDWMQLVGLIHDMGKIMFLWGDDSIGQNGESPIVPDGVLCCDFIRVTKFSAVRQVHLRAR